MQFDVHEAASKTPSHAGVTSSIQACNCIFEREFFLHLIDGISGLAWHNRDHNQTYERVSAWTDIKDQAMDERSLAMLGKAAVAAVLLAGTAMTAHAATVVFYDFDNEILAGIPQTNLVNAVSTKDALVVSATAWTAGKSGVLNQTGVGAPGGGVATNLRAIGAGPTVQISPTVFQWDPDQSLGFTFTIADGFKLKLTNVSFAERFGGGDGLIQTFTEWSLRLNGTEIARDDAIGGTEAVPEVFTDKSVALALDNLTGTIEMRFFGIGPFGTTPAGAGGNWRVDNFLLEGDFAPVPVPAAAWLFGSALAGLAAWRRRAA